MRKQAHTALKGGQGFTLIEVIISIAALSLISVFILQMFIISSRLSKDADDIDNAALVAQEACEMLRFGDSERILRSEPAYANYVVDAAGGNITLTGYFDDMWTLMPAGDGASYRLEATKTRAVSDGQSAAPSVAVSMTGPDEESVHGQLYNISVKLYRLPQRAAPNEALLCDYNTSRYYVVND